MPTEPLTRGLPPPDLRSVLCLQLNLLNPPEQNSWVRHCLQNQKSRGKSNQMWRPCWSASLTSKGSSTLNSYRTVRLLTSSFTLKCSSNFVMLCEENAPNFGGQVSGFCIKTAAAHTALSVRQFLKKKNRMTTASHPLPYSPDLAPCDFFLFPRMKRNLKGKRFQNVQQVREETTEALNAVTLQQFRTVWNSGKSGGIIVLIVRGSILRVITFWKCSEKCTI